MFSKKIFSMRLNDLRTQRGISQLSLANTLGIGKSAISMMEKGERAASIEVLYQLADYFDVSIDYLVGRTDNPKVNK